MAAKPLILKRKPPTRIVRKPARGQMPLELKPRVRLATRRKRAQLIGVSFALVAALVLTFGASAFSYHEQFTINDINVVGTQALSAAAVESTFGSNINDGIHHFFSRGNIFLYPQTELREALLRDQPLLQTVSFERESPLSQTLTISVTEREPKYLWCSNECYFMDANGFIFMKATNPSGFLEFRGGLIAGQDPVGQIFMRGKLDVLVALVEGVMSSGFTPEETVVENEHDITIRLSDGFLIKTTLEQTAQDVNKNLSLILASGALSGQREKIEYVDLRFGNRVYYKLKGQDNDIEQ